MIKPFYKGIGARFFYSFSALFSILIFITSILALRYASKMAQDNAENQLRVLSVVLSQQVQNYLKQAETQLASICVAKSVLDDWLQKEKTPEEEIWMKDWLDRKVKQMPAFDLFAVVLRNGNVLISTDERWMGKNLKKEPLFVRGLKGLYYNEIYEDPDSRQKVALLAAPIGSTHYPSGVLIGQLKFSAMYEMMDQQLGVSGVVEAFLLDSKLRFLTPGRTAPDELIGSHLIHTPLMKHLDESFWVSAYDNYEGDRVFGTVSRIKPYGWFLVLEQDYQEIERELSKMKRFVLSLSVVLLLAMLVVTIVITLSITQPLQILVKGARKMAEGELRHPIVVLQGAEEVLFLAREFEKMRVKLARYQQQLIERLEQSEQRRMESERLAAIGTLASSLAHEIRNPLNAMALLVSQLQLSKNHSAEVIEILHGIRSEIGRLDGLVTEILNFAKPVQLQKDWVDMQSILKKQVQFFQAIMQEKKIHCELEIPQDPLLVWVDADKIKQALINVMQNAIDAMPQGGNLRICLQLLSDSVVLEIEDSGEGIARAHQNQIFDLFFSTKNQGTGLGLSMVRKIIDAHGGHIDIESEAGKGTCVRIGFHLSSLKK